MITPLGGSLPSPILDCRGSPPPPGALSEALAALDDWSSCPRGVPAVGATADLNFGPVCFARVLVVSSLDGAGIPCLSPTPAVILGHYLDLLARQILGAGEVQHKTSRLTFSALGSLRDCLLSFFHRAPSDAGPPPPAPESSGLQANSLLMLLLAPTLTGTLAADPRGLMEARAVLVQLIRRSLLHRGKLLPTTDQAALSATPDALEHLLVRGPVDSRSITLAFQREVSYSLHACHRELHYTLAQAGPAPSVPALRPAALWAARALDLIGESGWVDFSGAVPPSPLPSPWWAGAAHAAIAAACLVLDAATAHHYASHHPLARSREDRPLPPPPPPLAVVT